MEFVLSQMTKAKAEFNLKQNTVLVAASKTKTPEKLMEVYNAGHLDFGENYVDELIKKCQEMPKDVRWHFIGHLQSNKVAMLLNKVPNLHTFHCLDSLK